MHFRKYKPQDKDKCLKIFNSNMPKFFAPHEEAEFAEFLNNPEFIATYFVLEENNQIVACGGYRIEDGVAGFAWGMVAYKHHKLGYGKLLAQKRLELLRQHVPAFTRVKLDTSQHSYGFFQKQGFVLKEITENFYAPGLHRYDMELSL